MTTDNTRLEIQIKISLKTMRLLEGIMTEGSTYDDAIQRLYTLASPRITIAIPPDDPMSFEEFYRDFIECEACRLFWHWKGSPCLTGDQMQIAMGYPLFRDGSHIYLASKEVMQRYKDFVEKTGKLD